YKMSFVAFSPLAQGLLLGKYNKNNPPQFEEGDHRKGSQKFSKENLENIEPKIEKLKQHFGSSVKELARVALQYLLKYNVVGAVIPGFRNLHQVKVNLSAMNKPLTDDEFNLVKNIFAEK
ncbi:MAG: aldo/keto reductase, partial [Ignavibacteriaceae bacterium]